MLLAAVALGAAWQCWRVGVNQDVRQAVGVLHAAERGGLGVVDVWAHRPLASRLLYAALGAVAPADPVLADRVLRVVATLLGAVAAAALGHGLRGRLGATGAGFVAVAVGAALVLAPTWDFAEPEWFAAAGAAAGVGIAMLAGRRTGPVLAGPVLAVVALLKYTTLSTAVVAVAAVWALDRFRGRWTALATAAATAVLFAATLVAAPHEWQWFRDMPLLNPPPTAAALAQAGEGWANHVLVSPLTAVALTVLVDLVLRGRGGRAGLGAAGLAVLAAPFVVQHQGFLYHLAALPVLAAAITAAALVRGHQVGLLVGVPWTWVATAVVATLAGGGVFAAGPRTREGLWWIGWVVTVVALLLPLVDLVLPRPALGRAPGATAPSATQTRALRGLLPMAVAPLVLVPLVVALSPRTAYSVSLAHSRVTAATNRAQAADARALARRVAGVLPPDAPVVHLGFATPWQLPNPTTCRYVSPTFLQRGALPGVRDTASHRENLACLDDPAARFAVVEKGWFDLTKVPAPTADAVRRAFPCPRPVFEDANVRICPRG